ncbi:uncharacterized protein VTP21DRAFT_8137 [Calcarisporiella thermophila]|uniref:uncharacterized protein n=1 Tax=Calcarisporiella thermophila TaxID=911321 RepID=UPI003742F6B3
MLSSYLLNCFWSLAGENQTKRIRELYFHSILHQDQSWFDLNQSESLNTRLSSDTLLIQDGLSEKVGFLLKDIFFAIACFTLAFYYGWRLSVVLLAIVPMLIFSGYAFAQVLKDQTEKVQNAGTLIEQCVSGIRTIIAFSMQPHFVHLLNSYLNIAYQAGVRKAWKTGEAINVAGSYTIGEIAPNYKALVEAQVAAHKIFPVIDRKPAITSSIKFQSKGIKRSACQGDLTFHDVHFSYPSRPSIQVLSGIDLRIPSGKTVAIVGASGGGKSTITHLIQRFYDLISGKILLDGVDLRELDYDTRVGELGSQLSGGQKQRIALARALIRNPAILLLDEATSALDTTSEKLMQDALKSASKNRTTLIIAHRLSTIRETDWIVVIENGKVVEQGTHAELMAIEGTYMAYVQKQQLKDDEDNKEESSIDSNFKVASKIEHKNKTSLTIDSNCTNKLVNSVGVDITSEKRPIYRALRSMSPEWKWIGLAAFGGLVYGAVDPISGLLIGCMVEVLGLPVDQVEEAAKFWSLIYLVLALISFFATILRDGITMFCGERFVRRLRAQTFSNLLQQATAYFDHPEHTTSALTYRLSKDATEITELPKMIIIDGGSALSAAVFGLFIAFRYGWKLTLMLLPTVPLIIGSLFFRYKSLGGFSGKMEKEYRLAGAVAGEAIREIRTITSLGVEDVFEMKYAAISQLSGQLPRFVKAKQAAINIFALLDKKPIIDPDALGRPSRSEWVWKVNIISLLLRWYDCNSGEVSVDGINVKEWQLDSMRQRIAYVGQEPVLFDMTVKENILLGRRKEQEVTQEDIEEVAKKANIHDFICSLPNGYHTRVGDKGKQISGGQKQRIAIARALLRKPEILLLDEATSALDSDSERLVQEALDSAMVGRTTLVIAHRLSTVQDSDVIIVMKDGEIQEAGDHAKLIAYPGIYRELVRQQNLKY